MIGTLVPAGLDLRSPDLIAECMTRRTEVEQLHLLRLRDVDVVRADVAMQQPAFVDDAQRIEHRHGDRDGLFIGDRPLQLQILHERQAVEVLHDEIARAMFAEEAEHRRDTGMIVEAHDGAAFLDDFERALKHETSDPEYSKGVELIYQRLLDTLKKMGLEPVEVQSGQAFDPNLHQAVVRVETDEAADNTILDEFQRGYNFRGKLLRPAMVRVAVKPSA